MSFNGNFVNSGPAGGGGAELPATNPNGTFILSGDITFGPHYVPNRISITKERNLSREENFCGNEDVEDLGAKNRDIHVSGRLLDFEVEAFNILLEHGESLDMVAPAWSGEVVVKGGEIEGPVAYDPKNDEQIFKYSLDLVSAAGRDVEGRGNGIISGTDGAGDRQLQR